MVKSKDGNAQNASMFHNLRNTGENREVAWLALPYE